MTVAAVLPPADAHACDCVPTSAKENFRVQPAAFTGRLLETKDTSDGRFLVYRYRVGWDYKDNLRETIRVRTPNYSSCAIPGTTVGNRYSMFLYRSEDSTRVTPTGPWTSNLCLQSTRAKLRKAAREAKSSGAAGSQVPCQS
ncbi:MAG: hypothetical protein QOJ22_668 [Thermoleophilaceae bacterium]|jgi:hypothetical protein|nr:hypothetical protein [Thermoleophilaceae bacterium]